MDMPDDLDHDFPLYPGDMPEGQVVKIAVEDGGGEYTPDPPAIPNEMIAERHLKAVGYYHRERARIITHATAHRHQIDAWERERLRPVENRLGWHEGGLRAWFSGLGRKSVNLVYGSVKRIAGRERVEITDEDALQKWAMSQGFETFQRFIRVKQEPNKVALKDYIQQGGEVPPGCDWVRGEDSIKVEAI